MKRGNLPISWVRWRHRRYQELVSQGLASALAYPIAAAEAKWRHRLSRIIGNFAARDAAITCLGRGGKLRFVLTGDIAGLSDEQVSALEELSSMVAGKSA